MRSATLVRITARLLTGYTYGTLGIDSFKQPGGRVATAASTLDKLRNVVPVLPKDDEIVVKANGLVQSAAGALLALGIKPRLMAATIVATLIPTTIAGHGFWRMEDAAQQRAQRIQFRKNAAMVGGLFFCMLDRPADRD